MVEKTSPSSKPSKFLLKQQSSRRLLVKPLLVNPNYTNTDIAESGAPHLLLSPVISNPSGAKPGHFITLSESKDIKKRL